MVTYIRTPDTHQAPLPGTQATRAELMDTLLKAIAAKDHMRAYDAVDVLINPDDAPFRQDAYRDTREAVRT